IKQSQQEVNRYFEKVVQCTLDLQDADPINVDKYNLDLEADQARYEDISTEIINTLASNEPTQVLARQYESKPFRINDALKPNVLAKDSTPMELRHWIEAFEAFYVSNHMESLTVREQQSYLKILLDNELKTRISAKLSDTTPVFGAGSCLELLKHDFDSRYPLFTRRLDYFQHKQRNGENFTDFWSRLREMGKLADIDKLSSDEILVFRGICGTTDKELLEDFLKLADVNTKSIEETARIHE
ncbi:Hypothetical predicted protein, partial [Paramuricea clavata]